MKSVINLSVVFLFILSACNPEGEMETRSLSTSSIEINTSSTCQQIFSIDNESVPIEIRKIGLFHNEIMEDMLNIDYISNMCMDSAYTRLQYSLDSLIKVTPFYNSYFDTISASGIGHLYLNEFNICSLNSTNRKIHIKSFINKIDSIYGIFLSAWEREFIQDFFSDILEENEEPLINYVRVIENNRSHFYDDGSLSLGILSVYDNSICFWNQHHQLNLSSRACGPCVVAGLWDAGGALYAGLKEIYKNGGDAGPNFPKKLGRGSLEASIPIIGGDIATWFGW